MPNALFINGILDSNPVDILKVQDELGASDAFLQPYKGQAIAMLPDTPPSKRKPVRLYMSTTEELGEIRHTAEIIRWENKQEMSASRRSQVTSNSRNTREVMKSGCFPGRGKRETSRLT